MDDLRPDHSSSQDFVALTTGTSVLSGGLWNSVGLLLPTLYVLAVSIVAARVLGPSGMGKQSFIAWSEISLVALFAGGIPIAITRFVGESLGRQRHAALRDLVLLGWRIEAVAAALGLLALVLVGFGRGDLRSAWFLAGVAAAMGILHSVPYAILAGLQRWRDAIKVVLVSGGLGTVATIWVLLAGGGITGMFAVEVATSAISMVWTASIARRLLRPVERVPAHDAELRRHVLRYAVGASLQVLLTLIVWRRSEFFFLDRYATAAEIALYSVPFSLVWAIGRLPAGLVQVMMPAVATLYGAGAMDRIRSGFNRSIRLIAIATLPLAAGGVAVGPSVIRLVYGNEYRGAGPVIVVMMLALPVLPIAGVASAILEGLGRLRTVIVADAVAAAVNVAFDFYLIPRHGATGAALANTAGVVWSAALLVAFATRVAPPGRFRPAPVVKAAVASAVAGLTGWAAVTFLPPLEGLIVGVLGGAAVFGGLAVALRMVPPDDAEWLDEVAGHRLRGAIGVLLRPFLQRPATAPAGPDSADPRRR